jgi:hypothetical protein
MTVYIDAPFEWCDRTHERLWEPIYRERDRANDRTIEGYGRAQHQGDFRQVIRHI